MSQLQKTIMRRVYYAFAIRLLTHPTTLYAAAFLGLVWWLKELVFVARIWEAVVSRPIGELGSFALELVHNADSLTLVVTAVTLAVAVGFARQLQHIPVPRLTVAG